MIEKLWNDSRGGAHATSLQNWDCPWQRAFVAVNWKLLAVSTRVSTRLSSRVAVLPMATTPTRCRWVLPTQHSVDIWNVFYSNVQYPQHAELGKRQSWWNPRTWIVSSLTFKIWTRIVGDIVVDPLTAISKTDQRYLNSLNCAWLQASAAK